MGERSAAGEACADEAACVAKVQSILNELDDTHSEMFTRTEHLRYLEGFREKLLDGERLALSSFQRQHLSRYGKAITDVSYDSALRPMFTAWTDFFEPVE